MKAKIMAVAINLYGEDGVLIIHSWVVIGPLDMGIRARFITHLVEDGEGVRIVLDIGNSVKHYNSYSYNV